MADMPGSSELNGSGSSTGNGGQNSGPGNFTASSLSPEDVARIFSGRSDQNMSTMAWATQQVGLQYPTTGCLRQAAIPLPLAPGDYCSDGFFCPNSTKDMPPQYCPPMESCQVSRDHGQLCPPQGFLEPVLCDQGSYCPPGGKQKLPCPGDHYCPYGTVNPIRCDPGAYCPSGSSKQIPLLPLGMTVVVDSLLVAFVIIGILLARCSRKRSRAQSSVIDYGDASDFGAKNLHDPEWLTNPPAYPPPQKLRNFSLPSLEQSPKDIKGILRSSFHQAKKDVRSGVRKVSFSTDTADHRREKPARWSPEDDRSSGFRSVFYPDPERSRGYHSQRYPPGVRRPSIPSVMLPSKFSSFSSASDLSLHGIAYSETFSPLDEFESNPAMQTFLRGLADAVHTQELGLSYQFKNLCYKVKGVGEILSGVSGNIRQGSMVGIMGGTGAGKSTLVNILMGKKKQTTGSVKICGYEMDMSKYNKLVGYVPQDDVLLPDLTVRENILHSARCRLPKSWKDKRIQKYVDALITCLALTHVQHSLVGDTRRPVISGGQRKRLSIGIELAAAPMAIFLDEPTTGLDAASAVSIMRLLKTISGLGVTTIAIIHQPREEIFSSFDSLLLLAEGKQLYTGPTSYCKGYFTNLGFNFPSRGNPADTIMDIITGAGMQYSSKSRFETSVQSLINYWQEKGRFFKWPRDASRKSSITTLKLAKSLPPRPAQSPTEQSAALTRTMKSRGASWLAQFKFAILRSFTQQLRQRTSFAFEISVAAVAGLIIGLSAFSSGGNLFHGIYHAPFALFSPAVDNNSSLQLALLSSMGIGLSASAPGVRVFGDEKLLHAREASAGHSRSAYFAGKQAATFMRIALAALHFTALMLVLATPRMTFPEAYQVNLAYFYAIYGLSSVVSVVVKKEDGPLLAVLSSLVVGVMGGVAPPLSRVKDWHLEWMWRVAPGTWFCEAYFDRLVGGTGGIYILRLAEEATGMTLGRFGGDVAMVFALGTAYRLIGFGLMIAAEKTKQRR